MTTNTPRPDINAIHEALFHDRFNRLVSKASDDATNALTAVGKPIPDEIKPYFLLEVVIHLCAAAEVGVAQIADIDYKTLRSDPDLERDLALYTNLLIRHYPSSSSWSQAFEHATLDFENIFGRACHIGQRILARNKEISR